MKHGPVELHLTQWPSVAAVPLERVRASHGIRDADQHADWRLWNGLQAKSAMEATGAKYASCVAVVKTRRGRGWFHEVKMAQGFEHTVNECGGI